MKDIAIYGAGGLGREVACLIKKIPEWNFIGFFDDGKPINSANEYGTIIGGMDELLKWKKPLNLVIAIGNSQVVKSIVDHNTNKLISYPNIIDQLLISDENNYSIGKGNIIMSRCAFSCNVHLGDFNILNGSVVFGHDAIIGSYNIIMPGTRISGEVTIGDNNFFGVGSIVLQQIKIGNNIKIGAGSVLVHKPRENSLYIGNPAKIFRY